MQKRDYRVRILRSLPFIKMRDRHRIQLMMHRCCVDNIVSRRYGISRLRFLSKVILNDVEFNQIAARSKSSGPMQRSIGIIPNVCLRSIQCSSNHRRDVSSLRYLCCDLFHRVLVVVSVVVSAHELALEDAPTKSRT